MIAKPVGNFWQVRCRSWLLPAIALLVACPETALAAPRANVVVILDASRSMWGQIDGVNKTVIAQKVLEDIFKRYDGRLNLGLVAYGHTKSVGCNDIQTLHRLAPLEADQYIEALKSIRPKGSTPIAAALKHAAKLIKADRQSAQIILISDGLDNCRGDPCATAAELKKKSVALKIHVIAFARQGQTKLKALSCMADTTGGLFSSAVNQADLTTAMTNALDTMLVPTAALPAAALSATQVPAQIEPDSGWRQEVVAVSESNAPAAGSKPKKTDTPTKIAAKPEAGGKTAQLPATMVPAKFKALIMDGGRQINSGLVWRIFEARKAENGKFKLISSHRDATPTAALAPGSYLVNAAYGKAHLTKKITVKANQPVEEIFVLNCGGLRLSSILANQQPVSKKSVTYSIYSDERDQFGKRTKVMSDAKPGLIIRLNAGIYHVVSKYGDANAIVSSDVTVEPGKLSEATVNHSAAKVSFKLVLQPGGEALANTKWSVLTPQGEIVKESTGALPTHILAAGTYLLLARYEGRNFKQEFNVTPGDNKQIEVVVQ